MLRRVGELLENTVAGQFGICYENLENGIRYFSSPTPEKGVQKSIPNSNVIRELFFVGDFDKNAFLSSLDKYFIRTNKTRVLPFFVKYLREFIRKTKIL